MIRPFHCLWVASLLAAATAASAQGRPSEPEPSSGWTPKQVAHAKRFMVAAANPLAVDAGVKMLEQGGNAIDAMVATQLVLNLVQPTSSGLGGGAFLIYYDAKARSIHALDGREVAPAAATPELFMSGGKPMAFHAARVGGRSVGVPGTPRLIEIAQLRYGKLPWARLFEPAIELAEKGFPVSRRLHRLIELDPDLAEEPAARAYFFDAQGIPKATGTILRNPEFAATLRKIAAGGADAYYMGEIAHDIANAVQGHRNAGTLSVDDLANYRVRDVDALCGNYRAHKLCGMPPSSSGGIAVLQILGELSRFDMASIPPGTAEAVHVISEAERLAFADRNKYVADDRYVDVPVAGLIDPAYLRARSELIQPAKSMVRAEAGHPDGVKLAYDDDPVDEIPGTTQIAIIDADGNAVSMTSTIESFFGSRVMVRGFLLNNELTDFNFQPVEDGVGVANRIAPGKRPRSSMAPFLVFDGKTGALEMAVGSPGGSLIIAFVAKTLVGLIDWKLDMQSAIDLPNFGSRNGPTEIENGTPLEALSPELRSMGHDVRFISMTSGIQGVRRVGGALEGGTDPRSEGVARGQ